MLFYHNGCTILYPHQTAHEGSLSFTSWPELISCVFDTSHSMRCEVRSHCVLIYSLLMVSNVEHMFMCLLALYISLEKYLFRSSAEF